MEVIMFGKYYPIPLMDELDANGGAVGDVVTPDNTDTMGTTGVNAGTADPIPDGTKPDAKWAELRRKAEMADKLMQENEGYKTKFDKLTKKALPEGFSSVDDYLDYLESIGETSETIQPETPVVDEGKIYEVLTKKIDEKVNEHPLIKAAEKERKDRFLVNSFKEAQKVFPDIKEAKDIPEEVWKAWDEGKSKRSLLSHLKEHRYDTDVESARKTGANQAKAIVMGTAHTAQVNGANAAAEYDNVIVPESVRKNLELVGVKDPMEQKKAYVKYHR
jgi:hypothetical protein